MNVLRTYAGLPVGFSALGWGQQIFAGMPATLPTEWTKEHSPNWGFSGEGAGSVFYAYETWQAISFFVIVVLLSAWVVQQLWGLLHQTISWLPVLSYSRALSFVLLWGVLFILVLTMISGARELMTPGAWRKQGWTYKLAAADRPADSSIDPRAERRLALEKLRTELWRYAATHQGRFPEKGDPDIDPALWNLPGWPGLQFLLISDREADDGGRLLAFEPEVDGQERQVLLTNGMIGTMRSADIPKAMATTEVSHEH